MFQLASLTFVTFVIRLTSGLVLWRLREYQHTDRTNHMSAVAWFRLRSHGIMSCAVASDWNGANRADEFDTVAVAT